MLRFLSFSILLALTASGLYAQEVVFTTRVNGNKMGKMGVQDVIYVQYEIKNAQRIQNLELVNRKDFKVLGEPSEGTNINMMNDRVSMSKIYTFRFQPKRTGRLSFPIAKARVKGQTIRSNQVSIDVVKGSLIKRRMPQQQMRDPFAEMMEDFQKMEEQMIAEQRRILGQRQRRNGQRPQQGAPYGSQRPNEAVTTKI